MGGLLVIAIYLTKEKNVARAVYAHYSVKYKRQLTEGKIKMKTFTMLTLVEKAN